MTTKYELDFLEACAALDAKKCKRIENEFGTSYTTDEDGILVYCGAPDRGIRRTPESFLCEWRLIDVKPVEHTEVIEEVGWHMIPHTGAVYPRSFRGLDWRRFIGKPKMKMTLTWME